MLAANDIYISSNVFVVSYLLGPILFLLYTVDLQRVVEQHQLLPHLYADDTQIYGACSPSTTAEFQNCVSSCLDDVAAWMQSNRLQLNFAKTEVLWCVSSQRVNVNQKRMDCNVRGQKCLQNRTIEF